MRKLAFAWPRSREARRRGSTGDGSWVGQDCFGRGIASVVVNGRPGSLSWGEDVSEVVAVVS